MLLKNALQGLQGISSLACLATRFSATYTAKPSDIQIVNTWKSKNTKYYNNAIITWTIRDVKKRNIAKENKLNYYEFFSMLNLNIWLRNNYEL